MYNGDWKKIAEDIRQTVQNAVDSQDFSKMNQTITNTINDAVEGLGKGLRGVGECMDRKMRTDQTTKQSTGYSYQQENGVNNKVPTTVLKRLPELFVNVSGRKIGAVAMMTTGYILGISLLLGLIIILVQLVFFGGPQTGLMVAEGILGILLIGSAILTGLGTTLFGKIKRYRLYISTLGNKEYCQIKTLAEQLGKSQKYVVKDITKLIRQQWFTQGYIDDQRTCFIVSNEAYSQYKEMMFYKENQKKQERIVREKEVQKQENMDPEIKGIIREGNQYIQKIHACNEAIPGVEISAKMSHMEILVDKIFDRVEQNPENVADIRRLMEYYLPTTVKLLEAYIELDAMPVQGENIISSKKEIEKTLDTLNIAFEKLLDSLFEDTAWDVASDISVLHTMLAQEGLTKEDF